MARYALIKDGVVDNIVEMTVIPSVPGYLVVLVTGPTSPGDSYTDGAFVPRVLTADEVERRAAPGALADAFRLLRAWADDAKTEAELTAMTAAQRLARQAVIELRVAALARAVAHLIRTMN